ncbi:MAG: DUF11 domain-containing protein [Oscillospiraceae bacterium]|nr:DUF11 domain-containing protein [Oscillospiraceae bacterium]MBQ9109091.1 DUF11 domain-containing protein [Oscillospiraceae bacterium]
MPTFTNQATLRYNDTFTNSNIVTGQIVEVLSATKTALTESYSPGDAVTYVISLVNSGTQPFTGLQVSDDLGGYLFNGNTLYPLAYVDGSVLYLQNGAPQTAPTVMAGPPLQYGGITVPAGGNATLIYQATTNSFAPLGTEGEITNTVTVTGGGLSSPVTAQETIATRSGADLGITKAVSPVPVAENGRLTYTFVIRNQGNTAAVATDNLAVTDTFDPILTDLTVTLDGVALTEGVDYTYNEATGEFATAASRITVPAATFVQAPDGSWGVTPGTATLVVTGTV